MIEAPIFHVNGDDPEAVVFAAKVATEFRQKFHKPVVVDMFCYRRFGHNEGDEPAFTQPLMYKKIRTHPGDARALRQAADRRRRRSPRAKSTRRRPTGAPRLEAEFEAGQAYKPNKADWLDGALGRASRPRDRGRRAPRRHRRRDRDAARRSAAGLTTVPEGFNVHRTIQRFLETARKTIDAGEGIDWATGEALAFGSLLRRGPPRPPVRPGRRARHLLAAPLRAHRPGDREALHAAQPSRRRPGALRGHQLDALGGGGARLRVRLLARRAEGPDALGGAVRRLRQRRAGVFDQFISSGERKWLRMSGLVCLLPHGYEGQGPEHSSARLERFLQMCAEDNMQVANCTTPANYFHILRRQMKRDFRKPLILMTPKSLLRHKRAVSRLDEMGAGHDLPSGAVRRCADAAGRADQAGRRRQDPPRRAVLGQGLFRPLRGAREARHRRRLSAARRAALSVPAEVAGAPSSRASRRRMSGARKSRRTWAPGPSSSPSRMGARPGRIKAQAASRYAGRPPRPRPPPA